MIHFHPRPQFQRNDWETLDGQWQFAFDDENLGVKNKWYVNFPSGRRIEVPFTYETKASGIHDPNHYQYIWYSRQVQFKTGKNILLHFEGSDYLTTVWINGEKAGEHKGGYTAFTFDITPFVISGENTITIRVEDSPDTSQPRGKQRWLDENFGCWYVQTTGIWKTVWLEYVSDTFIEYVKITPNLDEHSVTFEIETNNQTNQKEIIVQADISFSGEKIQTVSALIKDRKAKMTSTILKNGDIWSVQKWSPETPNLYDVTFSLRQNEDTVDELKSYFGIRKISIEGNKILLNNEELYQRLILDQGYWEESELTPPSMEALEKDIDRILALGYNGLRKHQKIEDNRFLYLCDKKGLLVWSEMAATYSFDDKAIANFTNEWLEILKQHYSHPSIITWVPFNESWGISNVYDDANMQHFTEGVYYLTKTFDPMRPVITNDGWEHTLSDIITLHDYEEVGEVLYNRYKNESILLSNQIQYNQFKFPFAKGFSYKGQPVIISEFGGIAFATEKGWGYGNQVKNEEEFMKRFDQIHQAIQNLEYVSGYCYTQLTDVQQEVNGLLDVHREPKVDIEQIRKINERRKK
ncbi:glycoside hydrolase family 2 protein [Heyndrickxia ginsengihumi]|uniref:glycoside hydrolase family 2 protein n=1 Tax=Heyndrickxia ginsengihumi TaxID=363870 RepID=UPI003D243D73